MSQEIRNLEPKALWNKFADLNAVPRPSKKEERVIQFMKDFGNSLGLETFEDDIRNVIIRKPATPGMENRKTVVLQGHLDMVHQKNGDTNFDFDKQGIDMYVDGDWVRARGTHWRRCDALQTRPGRNHRREDHRGTAAFRAKTPLTR